MERLKTSQEAEGLNIDSALSFNAHADKLVLPFCEKFARIYRFLNAFSITTLLLVRL